MSEARLQLAQASYCEELQHGAHTYMFSAISTDDWNWLLSTPWSFRGKAQVLDYEIQI